jgi:ABC-type nitrate/sulfonate/bicarbonate transport system substrate-binding protein
VKANSIGLSGRASLFLARAHGAPVRALSASFQNGFGSFLWREAGCFGSIANFNGKKASFRQTARARTEAMLTIYTLRVELVSLVASGFGVLPLLPG